LKDSYTPTVSGGTWSVQVTATQAQALADGTYTIKADLTDAAGNPAPEATAPATIETASPAHQVTLVQGGFPTATFATIQAAVDAASSGDTIVVGTGTFNEHVNLDKSVTILGANAGVDGSATRGAESKIVGGVTVTADGATINGVEISGSYDSVSLNGTD